MIPDRCDCAGWLACGMTTIQILERVCHFLNVWQDQFLEENEKIEDLQKQIDDLQKYIDNYFQSQTFTDQIDAVVQGLMTTGAFNDIINMQVDAYLQTTDGKNRIKNVVNEVLTTLDLITSENITEYVQPIIDNTLGQKNYATQTDLESTYTDMVNYVSQQGFATQDWVNNKGYLNLAQVDDQIMTDLEKYRYYYSLADFSINPNTGSDVSSQIQNVITRAHVAGKDVFIPAGQYIVHDLIVYSGQKIFGIPGASILVNNTANSCTIRNYTTGAANVYNAANNIVLKDLYFQTNVIATSIALGHSQYCTIMNCTFNGNTGWHMIELCGCHSCIITNNKFFAYGEINPTSANQSGSEMIQLDSMYNADVFPFFGPYDNTSCAHVLITNNIFNNTRTTNVLYVKSHCIGNHTSVNSCTDILISENLILYATAFVYFTVGSRWQITNNIAIYVANFFSGIVNNVNISDIVINNNLAYGYHNITDTDIVSELGGVYLRSNALTLIPTRITITNNQFQEFFASGIGVQAHNVIIANNLVSGVYNHTGLSSKAIGIWVAYIGSNQNVHDNIVYDAAEFDLLLQPATGGTGGTNYVYNNVCQTCYFECPSDYVGLFWLYHNVMLNYYKIGSDASRCYRWNNIVKNVVYEGSVSTVAGDPAVS